MPTSQTPHCWPIRRHLNASQNLSASDVVPSSALRQWNACMQYTSERFSSSCKEHCKIMKGGEQGDERSFIPCLPSAEGQFWQPGCCCFAQIIPACAASRKPSRCCITGLIASLQLCPTGPKGIRHIVACTSAVSLMSSGACTPHADLSDLGFQACRFTRGKWPASCVQRRSLLFCICE